MDETMSVTEARQNLLQLTKRVSERMGRVLLTNKGRAETVLMSVVEYRGLRAAAELAMRPGVLEATRQGFAQIAEGRGMTMEEAFAQSEERAPMLAISEFAAE